MAPIIAPLLGLAGQLIDKIFPDPEKAAEAKAQLIQMQQQGELKELEISMSAIVMEAKSEDPWTSRARPSFLYVIYTIILFSLPMGLLTAFSPETATQVANGFKAWLDAIPGPMWDLFAIGYLGYAGARTWDKREILKAKK